MVTSDEKWITHDNIKRKRSWSKTGKSSQKVAKPRLTARKVLLYLVGLQWNNPLSAAPIWQDALFFHLLQTTGRLEVVFHKDNAGPHTSLMTRQNLGWEVLSHPPYTSPDYHLFLSIANARDSAKLDSKKDCEK